MFNIIFQYDYLIFVNTIEINTIVKNNILNLSSPLNLLLFVVSLVQSRSFLNIISKYSIILGISINTRMH